MDKNIILKEAITRMKLLNFDDNIIEELKNNAIYIQENSSLRLPTPQERALIDEVADRESIGLIYYVIHQFTNIGELYSMLFVSNFEEDWEIERKDCERKEDISSFVYNVTQPDFSEMGYIGIEVLPNNIINRIF